MSNIDKLEVNLKKNGFDFYNFKNRKDLCDFIIEDMEAGRSIYFGGSKTLEDLDLFELLNKENYNVNWHWKEDFDLNNKRQEDRKYYLTSSNAITEDGKLVNMDGLGNRVSAMIIGYERVYVVVGKNKVVKDEEEARDRIRSIAAPLNAKRLGKKTPCVESGRCMDCNSDDRICRAEVILHKNPSGTDIRICYLDENLGY